MGKSKWVLDTAHSQVDFSVKHMMISRVNGTFQRFSANIEADPNDLTTADIEFSVEVDSIDTRNTDRDNHLKSADFFNAEQYPNITFKATEITRKDDSSYHVTGDLTIRGVTRKETFVAEFEGLAKDPLSGNEKAGFTVTGTINRKDYGLVWNVALETGGVLVGEEVKITVHIEAARAE
ncbi:MAG: polyisoprenoid-binding protein [Caldibacillus debilis]|jgi:polyisoprenoid-binding protein YceI|uniref:Polyisoprenoid-binding protein n=1 Tax=Caldibacillus debilis TaxID=301148 RepID=A0A150M3A5_9BACI|nr:YceI family protein [Caldibacillus debilis]MBO2481782.1 polyisoprenoid-binding protein [Bacillaceae bacterium]KYD18722.1 hypothetical protein B4135_2197 [Caldibacillus debilis]MBY6272724.1 polyisoprenoid-binding protein [Bacillaceae bacterium]OUM86991.1 MAG: hypothetical protein BAA03_04060 [Caldibacillus debilis]REJ18087.1 MAG: polyisoprenoid-binding protein [Caldibacillus debilis]